MKKILAISIASCIGLMMCHNAQKNIVSTPQSKNIAWVVIDTKKNIKDDPKVAGTLSISKNDSLLVSTPIGIELRGAVSSFVDKKSYGLEIRDVNGQSFEISLLGMPKDDDWILLGPMMDRSMIRNALAYTISNKMGRYAAKSEFVELQVNGDFKGLYLLMEKLKKKEEKIKIEKLDKTTISGEDLTGGYILKIDKTAGNGDNWSNYSEKNSFNSQFDDQGKSSKNSNIHYLYEYPKEKLINDSQKAYIEDYINQFEKGMASNNSNENIQTIEKYVDLASFVDYFILTEWMQNNDGYRISTYLQKDKNKKLAMGPIWDCDLAFGPENSFCEPMRQDNWVYRYNEFCGSDDWLVPFWWTKLTQTPVFKKAVLARWQELRQGILADKNVAITIDELVEPLQKNKMIDRNYERWSESKSDKNYQKRYQKHVNHLKNWTIKHAAWLDKNMIQL